MGFALSFVLGLLALGLFIAYLIAEKSRQRRLVGTFLTLVMVGISLESAMPLKEKINLGLDLQGGTSFLLRLQKLEGQRGLESGVLEKAVEVIRKRIDKFGVSEPVITPEGEDRILVQIPGMSPEKIEEARIQLQKVAKLELKLVHPESDRIVPEIVAGLRPIPPGYMLSPLASKEEPTALESANGKEAEEKTAEEAQNAGEAQKKAEKSAANEHPRYQFLVPIQADIEGKDVLGGSPFFDNGSWGVGLRMNSEGAEKFGRLTADNIGGSIAIVLDGVVQSAPRINSAIYGGNASITGRFSEKEARDLASVLENPLSVPVEIFSESSASSTLGADAIRSGIYAGIGGMAAVMLFILFFYRTAGIIAIISLIVNIILLIGGMAMFNFVLTLPGIAGIILTIGLAVDASVLIFERLREELDSGKTLKGALDGAYSKAFSVIIDANVTTLIMAGILFWKASGPVRGFAVTLTMGVIASVFTAMIVGRTLFTWATDFGLSKISMCKLIPDGVAVNFLGKWRLWLAIAALLSISSVGIFWARGEHNFGIDFKGGDMLQLSFVKPVTEEQVRSAIDEIGLGSESVVQLLKEKDGQGGVREYVNIRSPFETADKIAAHLQEKMPEAGFVEHQTVKIGKVVGGELLRNSLIALGLGMLGILIFVGTRFEFAFALGAITALLHDVIVTLGLFAVTGRELSLVMIGAILAIAGYSINDTIVIFDRIRESLHAGRKGTVQELMNSAINETLSRTILTSGTTFLAAASLYFFGGPVLHDFAFTIMAGILIGTYSSIFIAPPMVLWFSSRKGHNLADEVLKKAPAPGPETSGA